MGGRRRWVLAGFGGCLTLAVLLAGLTVGPGQPRAAAAPRTYLISGGGYGHGIGMSQYGAYGMALRGLPASRILAAYYGGARAAPARPPARLRVGLLQADRDPRAGGRLARVVVRGLPLPGQPGTGALLVTGLARSGRLHRQGLAGREAFVIRPHAGGTSVFTAGGRLVFGPTRSGTGVLVHYQRGPRHPALLELPQTRQLLRWGRLEVGRVHDGRVARPRAVAVMGVNRYLGGLGEMPASWPREALRAQAIAARSYALATLASRGQHSGRGRWNGCDCGLYGDVRDQHYSGFAKERGVWGARWVSAVRSTGNLVVRWRSRMVQAFYSSSSGGHTASNTVWGSAPLPWLPSRPDPDDKARGRNPNFRWKLRLSAETVSQRLAGLGVGRVTGLAVASRYPASANRVATVRVAGTRGRVVVSGTTFRRLLGLKSTRFSIIQDP
jgi:stage II sporulation protein D